MNNPIINAVGEGLCDQFYLRYDDVSKVDKRIAALVDELIAEAALLIRKRLRNRGDTDTVAEQNGPIVIEGYPHQTFILAAKRLGEDLNCKVLDLTPTSLAIGWSHLRAEFKL